MSGVTPYYPVPIPTPYQSPAQGGNPYVTQGAIGPAIPSYATPNVNQSYADGSKNVSWSTGQVTPSSTVNTGAYASAQSYPKPTTKTPTKTEEKPASSPAPAQKITGGALDEMVEIGGVRKTKRSAMAEGLMDEYGNLITQDNRAAEEARKAAEEQQRLIDESYRGSYDYLNQAEQMLRGFQPQNQADIERQYQTSKGVLGTQKEAGIKNLEQSLTQGQRQKEDVITAARRLAQELAMGNLQRFGGASSAGQAASELQGREFQRTAGRAQQGYVDFEQEIAGRKAEVETGYTNQLAQLEDKKNAAINQATQEFQSKLLEIAGKRGELEQNKAQQKIAALDAYRQTVQAIQAQQQQFIQSLQAQKYASDLQLDNYAQQLAMQSQYGQSGFQNYMNTNQTPTNTAYLPGMTTSNGGFNINQSVGQIAGNKDDYLKMLTGVVSPTRGSDLTGLYGGLSNIQSMAR